MEDDSNDSVSRTEGAGSHDGDSTEHAEQNTGTLSTGTVLSDRYRVLGFLGKGGMGEVYLGEHTKLRRKVAIKVAVSSLNNQGALRKRFIQEARAASLLYHENIVDIIDFGETGGMPFFVMEHLEGQDLAKLLQGGPLHPDRARRIACQILAALTCAHERKVVHRDIKPANCFVIAREQNPDFIKVLDFGLAKILSENRGMTKLTHSGMVVGSFKYIAPEQAKGERIDHRADLYAVGAILFEMLTGKPPFESTTLVGLLHKHINVQPPSPRKLAPTAEIDRHLEEIVLRALAKKPNDRFASAREFAAALAGDTSSSVRTTWKVASVAVSLTLLAVLVWLYAAGSTPEHKPAHISNNTLNTRRTADDPLEPPSTTTDDTTTNDDATTDLPAASGTPETTEFADDTTESEIHGSEEGGEEDEGRSLPAPRRKKRSTPAKAAPGPKKRQPVATAASKKLPEKLTRAAVATVFRDRANALVRKCGAQHGAFPGESISFSLDVAANGQVKSVSAKLESPNPPMRRCLVQVVGQVEFPESKSRGRYRHTVQL